MYCVYLTIYKGNKLPPFYIGYSTVYKVTNKNYRGSVSSYEYKEIWDKELKENPNLFSTKIISHCELQSDVWAREKELQRKLDVINNPLYINKAIAGHANNSGKRNITNGILDRRILPNLEMPEGWWYGESDSYKSTRGHQAGIPHKMTEEGLVKIAQKRSGNNSSSKRPEVRKKISSTLTGIKLSKERVENQKIRMKGEGNHFYGKTHNDTAKELNRISHLGFVVAKDLLTGNNIRVTIEEFNSNSNLTSINVGKFWITDGVINKMIPKDSELPEGFRVGMTKKYE